MKRPSLTIVIPTFNEGDIIESSLKTISSAIGDLNSQTEVIIADDGSDDLPQVIDRCRNSFDFTDIIVTRNVKPIGKGGSIQNAFKAGKGTIIGFLDVDLSVAPTYIHKAINEINKGNDLVIASRVGNRFEIDKSIITSLMATIFKFIHQQILFFGKRKFSDTQCGFKFFKQEVALNLYNDLVATDGLNDLEILLKAVNSDYKISEIQVPRINDRVGKIRISTILTRETLSLWRIFRKYKLGL